MTELVVDWSTTDPASTLARVLREAAALPEWSMERWAAEGALHSFMADYYQRKIGERLAQQGEAARVSERAHKAAAARGAATGESDRAPSA